MRTLTLSAFVVAAAALGLAPADEERPTFSHVISMMARESFSTHSAATPQQQHAASGAAASPHHATHMAHVATRSVVLFATNIVETVPSYFVAVGMVLSVVLIFALCWGCFYCLCFIGAERRASQAAKKRKKGQRLS